MSLRNFLKSFYKFNLGSNGTCGPAVQVAASQLNATSEISLRGSHFHNKPTDACTIALWVKLEDETGKHRLFYTTGFDHLLISYLINSLNYSNLSMKT